MVWMIVLFAFGIRDHRIVPRHPVAAWSDHGIEINMGRTLEMILGKELAIDFDPKLVLQLFDLNPLPSLGGGKTCGNRSVWNSGQPPAAWNPALIRRIVSAGLRVRGH